MRAILTAILIFGFLSGPLAAQDERIEAIEAVISSQIQAFKSDDFATAFTFASPGIQRFFGGPERFGAMVRQGSTASIEELVEFAGASPIASATRSRASTISVDRSAECSRVRNDVSADGAVLVEEDGWYVALPSLESRSSQGKET